MASLAETFVTKSYDLKGKKRMMNKPKPGKTYTKMPGKNVARSHKNPRSSVPAKRTGGLQRQAMIQKYGRADGKSAGQVQEEQIAMGLMSASPTRKPVPRGPRNPGSRPVPSKPGVTGSRKPMPRKPGSRGPLTGSRKPVPRKPGAAGRVTAINRKPMSSRRPRKAM